jgi:hypothetical protein
LAFAFLSLPFDMKILLVVHSLPNLAPIHSRGGL